MIKYGEVAIRAVESVQAGQTKTPVDAWDLAVKDAFPSSLSAQQKGVPKERSWGYASLDW